MAAMSASAPVSISPRRTWADVVSGLGAVGLAVASFLPQSYAFPATYSGEGDSFHTHLWQRGALVPLVLVVVLNVALTVLALASPRRREAKLAAGLALDQWRVAAAVIGFLLTLLGFVSAPGPLWGSYLLVLSAAALAVGTAGVAYLPVLAGGVGAGATAPIDPFWFAVPEARPVFRPDSMTSRSGELAPGEWHLALRRYNGGLLVRSAAGREAVLFDVTNLTRA
jgi:hypothetical protein